MNIGWPCDDYRGNTSAGGAADGEALVMRFR
jgi:hypothetical protein